MLVGLALVSITGADWLDPAVALVLAAAIVREGFKILNRSSRVLVDEALPADELDAISAEVRAFGPQGVAGFHKLRARRAGARRYVDLHVQFVAGTTLEQAHETAHRLQDAIATRIPGADVLIHLEPEDRVQPGTRSEQVDRRARADGDRERRVALVAADEQQDRRDQAGGDGDQPGDARQRHDRHSCLPSGPLSTLRRRSARC